MGWFVQRSGARTLLDASDDAVDALRADPGPARRPTPLLRRRELDSRSGAGLGDWLIMGSVIRPRRRVCWYLGAGLFW